MARKKATPIAEASPVLDRGSDESSTPSRRPTVVPEDVQEPLDAPEVPTVPTVHIRAKVGILDLLWGEEAVVERTAEIQALLANGLLEEVVVDDRD